MQHTLKAIGVLAALSLVGSSCDSSASKETDQAPPDSTYAPVETKEANSDYQPAFEGQTRIAGVKTRTAYEVKLLSEGLNRPWGIAVLPDGRLLITEKEGTFRIATSAGSLSDAITGIPKVYSEGQGGLLGVTIDPDFQHNRMIYWSFAQDTPQGSLTAVGKGRLADDEKTVENASVIYQATPAHKGKLHYGGRLLFGKDGYLFASTGERSDIETRPQAQDLNSALGKVLRITPEGKPAPGNPFEGRSDARPELYSYGHRNVQGLALHPVTGELWEAEFGPRGGDEVNLIGAGKNYGWPVITYGLEYSGAKVGDSIQRQAGMEQPVYYWDPVLSPSGMTFFSGNSIPEWENNLFIAGLSSVHIARLVIKDNKVVGEERLATEEAQRFRDVQQGRDGALYAITDSGRLYRIGK